MEIKTAVFNPLQMIGLDKPNLGGKAGRLEEVNFVDLLDKGKIITKKEKNEILLDMNDLAVDWYYDGDDIEITQIWNNTTGEIYREYNDLPENRGWSEGDELVVCSILMWGELD